MTILLWGIGGYIVGHLLIGSLFAANPNDGQCAPQDDVQLSVTNNYVQYNHNCTTHTEEDIIDAEFTEQCGPKHGIGGRSRRSKYLLES